MTTAHDPDCLATRIAWAGRHVDRGEWASGHAILSGLRQCAARPGCPSAASCALAADMLMGDLMGLVRDENRAATSHP